MKCQFGRLCQEEKAQALYLVAALMFVLIGMAALSIDIGYALHGQRELQASADAAATAGAQILSQNVSATQAEAAATQYSGMQGAYNQINDLMSVKMPINTVRCLNTLVTTLGLTCDDVADANAVAVEETAQAPTFFGKIFGIQSINLTAYSMAGIQGGTLIPANIMVIMDTTASMQDPDSDATCVAESGVSSPSKEDCAKWGVRTFLNLLNPCSASLTSCGAVSGSPSTGYNVANPVDEVAVLVFPGLASATTDAPYDYDCQAHALSTSNGTIVPYGTPSSSPPYFTIVQLSSDYKTSNTSGLNAGGSDVVDTVSWASQTGCSANNPTKYGLQDPGGESTYYAGVIAEANNDLSNLQVPRANMQSAIILLSDGDAEASKSDFSAAALAANPTIYENECHQAIKAAANAAGTQNLKGMNNWVYAIAFAASTSTSSSCKTDTAAEPISGCQTMYDIASDPNKFYNDGGKPSDGSSPCNLSSHGSIGSLATIFSDISHDFQSTMLVPWGTQ
jgi:Flp pilus assembly protein TadG